MTTSAPTLEEWFKKSFESFMLDVRTAMPCKVDAYYPATQTVDVKPMVKDSTPKSDGTVAHESIPTIPNIPLAHSRMGNWFLAAPIAPGDFVYVVFSERNLATWRANGFESDEKDPRRHLLDGAVAFPVNVYPSAQPLTTVSATNMVLGKDAGTQIHIKEGQVALGTENPAEFVALATKTLTELTSIQTQVNVLIATLNANVAVFAAHTHGGVTVGAGVTGVAIGAMAPGVTLTAPNAVAATITKAA